MNRQTNTKLSWGPECGPDRRWLDEALKLNLDTSKVKLVGSVTLKPNGRFLRSVRHPGAKIDARESGSGYVDDPEDGYVGDLFSGLDDARDRGEL